MKIANPVAQLRFNKVNREDVVGQFLPVRRAPFPNPYRWIDSGAQ
ncbi:MAG: hypothetical protein ACXV5K_11560 [Halobacteriota archaeon]